LQRQGVNDASSWHGRIELSWGLAEEVVEKCEQDGERHRADIGKLEPQFVLRILVEAAFRRVAFIQLANRPLQ
jgi:hypothetical protein